jgi:hypothetical protein
MMEDDYEKKTGDILKIFKDNVSISNIIMLDDEEDDHL